MAGHYDDSLLAISLNRLSLYARPAPPPNKRMNPTSLRYTPTLCSAPDCLTLAPNIFVSAAPLARLKPKKEMRSYEEISKRDILGYRISWNDEFDFRDNYGSPLVVFCLTMVVCRFRISFNIFLGRSSLALYT
jgi:hypothetical protein